LAIEPISNIIAKVKEINSSKLSSRLDEGKKQDEIEQLAVTFNKMLADLESVFKLQDEFVTNASHELRTPLAILIAESDYILSNPRKPEEYETHISTISIDLRKLNLLLNSLLELAHLNRNNYIPMSVLRLDEPILIAVQSIKSKYPGRKVVFKIESSENETDLLIKGNSGLLEIAFMNLIDNACKFSSGDVEILLSKTKESLVFKIKDKGIGIPAKEIDMIFHPFLRGTNVKYIGGFGVGLALVAKIIELHNATIHIKSAENQGSEFTISFEGKLG
jgi:signal transduction histidine kinase